MSKTLNDFLAEAKAATGVVPPREAHESDCVILDVREADELSKTGKVPGSVHIPRGFLEAKGDPTAESADANLTVVHGGSKPVYVLCASGARAAMAAKTLSEMGYVAKSIEGGLKAWRESGLPVTS